MPTTPPCPFALCSSSTGLLQTWQCHTVPPTLLCRRRSSFAASDPSPSPVFLPSHLKPTLESFLSFSRENITNSRFPQHIIQGISGKGSDRHCSSLHVEVIERRQVIFSSLGLMLGAILSVPTTAAAAPRSEFADMPALRGKDYGKTKMRYPDYTETGSGLQYKDLRRGTSSTPKVGDTVVVDWDGYTIGYYGRIFEARNKTKGGSFEGDDKNYFKFKLGSQEVIPAFEEAVLGMSLGGIRRIIVPPELGYLDNDLNKMGPKPTTFSGQRALDFVLKNQGLIDKTLLFDVELLKIIPN